MPKVKLHHHLIATDTGEHEVELTHDGEIVSVEVYPGPETTFSVVTATPVRASRTATAPRRTRRDAVAAADAAHAEVDLPSAGGAA